MSDSIHLIAFDADDTLWDNERLYIDAQARLKDLLAPYYDPAQLEARLLETESRNMARYGYGIKAFGLSMIETAVQLSQGRITGPEIAQIIATVHAMLEADVLLMPGAAETLAALAQTYPLMLITKGDLLDQERKLKQSGLQPYFRYVEILSDKTPGVYAGILARLGLTADRFLMVGNSLRSDILPVLELGGQAVYVPYASTWAHESVSPEQLAGRQFHQVASLGELAELIHHLY